MTALALAFVWGCGDAGDGTSSLDSESAAEPRPSADATIKIGTILPSSGALSVTGPNSEVAIALAFEIVMKPAASMAKTSKRYIAIAVPASSWAPTRLAD